MLFDKKILLLLLTLLSTASAEQTPSHIELIIGTYSKKGSEGIYTTRLDTDSGRLSEAKLIVESKDPTYLAISNKGVIYAAVRESIGFVSAFSRDSTNKYSLISKQSTHGNDPCYLSLSPNEKYIASANYNGSNVTIFSLSSSGALNSNPVVISHTGSSANPKRQKSPHPHWVQWSPYNEQTLYVIDLGIDKVMKYELSAVSGEVVNKSVAFNSLPGSGPRHLVFHPTKNIAYILNEISNTVDSVKLNTDGTFTLIDHKSTLPDDYTLHNQSAHIAIDKQGKYLYTSNRGLNSIAIFNIDNDGQLTLKGNTNTGGKWPRFFKLFEKHGFLLVANKNSNNIVVYKIKRDGGLLKTSHQLQINQPTFIEKT